MVTAETAIKDWLTRAEAMSRLECTHKAITLMVEQGLIRRRQVPGHRRYWREDVERIAAPPKPA